MERPASVPGASSVVCAIVRVPSSTIVVMIPSSSPRRAAACTRTRGPVPRQDRSSQAYPPLIEGCRKPGGMARRVFPALAVELGWTCVLTICVPTRRFGTMTARLRDEIRQNRPFQSLEQEAYLRVVRTASVLSDRLERVLEPAGITLPQYNVLRILRGSHDNGGLCRNDLRERMLTRMPDVTRLLDRLEAAGYVRRTRDTEDRRMVN